MDRFLLWLLVVVGSAALAVFLALVIPPISRRRNRRRTAAAGAFWVGLANFDAAAPGSDPTIGRAFADVASTFARRSRRSRRRVEKPVGGLLFVGEDGLRWKPGLWLRRGRIRPWALQARAVLAVEIEKLPFPAVNSFRARLRTTTGDAFFLVVDPQGFQDAIAKMHGKRPHETGAV